MPQLGGRGATRFVSTDFSGLPHWDGGELQHGRRIFTNPAVVHRCWAAIRAVTAASGGR